MKSIWRILLALSYMVALNLQAEPALEPSLAIVPHEDPLHINPALTLHDVLEKTVARSPKQALIAAQKHQVDAKRIMAESGLPLAPSITFYHQNDALGSGRNERDWQTELELPIWLPNQKNARREVASQTEQNMKANSAFVTLDAAGVLRDALWSIKMTENEVGLFTRKLAQAQSLERDITKKYNAGELAKTDVLLVQQERLDAEKNLLRANAELMHARFRYTQLTGLNEIPAHFEEQPSALESYESSPQWQSAESKVTLAKSERDLTMVERRENPQFILNARSSQGAFDYAYNQSVGFKIRIPFDAPVRSAPLLADAEQSLGQAISQKEALRLALENNFHEAEHNLSVSRQEVVIAASQAEIAKNNASLALKAYQVGEMNVMDLLRIQTAAFEAEKNFSRQQIQLQWNIARYNQAVGELP